MPAAAVRRRHGRYGAGFRQPSGGLRKFAAVAHVQRPMGKPPPMAGNRQVALRKLLVPYPPLRQDQFRSRNHKKRALPFIGDASPGPIASVTARPGRMNGCQSFRQSEKAPWGIGETLVSVDERAWASRHARFALGCESHFTDGAAVRARGSRDHPRRLHHREQTDAGQPGGLEHLWRHRGERFRALRHWRRRAPCAVAFPLCGGRPRAPLRRQAQTQCIRAGGAVPGGARRGVRRLHRLRLVARLARPL